MRVRGATTVTLLNTVAGPTPDGGTVDPAPDGGTVDPAPDGGTVDPARDGRTAGVALVFVGTRCTPRSASPTIGVHVDARWPRCSPGEYPGAQSRLFEGVSTAALCIDRAGVSRIYAIYLR
jgi:hypothetical protein